MRLTALDERAEAIGLRIGQGLAEARAICPSLDVIEADADADRVFLDALADWCDRYTPLVAVDDENGLMLDISGCAHLFGGEEKLLDDLVRRLTCFGLDVRGSVAPTPGLAWAAARFDGPAIIPPADGPAVLASLPVKALRLASETCLKLARVGLKQVGELMAAPRGPIMRRFGPEPLLRLDRALGREGEPISPRRPLAMLSVERRLAEPISLEAQILDLAGRLACGLKAGLQARGEGGRLFELLLFRVDGRVFRIEVGTSAPLNDAVRIRSLFSERLCVLRDDLDAGFGFELIRLNVLRSESLAPSQPHFDQEAEAEGRFGRFLDQVSARLGPRCLTVPTALASHWPDRAALLQPLGDGLPSHAAPLPAPQRGVRPLRLFARPEPVEVTAELPDGPPAMFRWRRSRHRVARAEGPERLAPEWWVDGEASPPRDYFRIEDSAGHRFWLFREGLYERGADHPEWYMQGVFA